MHRRPKGGLPGAAAPWNLKMVTSYTVPVENTLKCSLAPSALAINTLNFVEGGVKNVKALVCAVGAQKNGRLFLRQTDKMSTS